MTPLVDQCQKRAQMSVPVTEARCDTWGDEALCGEAERKLEARLKLGNGDGLNPF